MPEHIRRDGVVGAFGGREVVDEATDAVPQVVGRAGFAEQVLEPFDKLRRA